MRRIVIAAVGAALLVTLASCSPPGAEAGGDTVDRTYTSQRLNWRSGKGGFISSVKVKNSGGLVMVCGVFAEVPGVVYTELTDQVANRASVHLGDERLFLGLQHFKKHAPTQTLIGKGATCFKTTTPWQAAFKGQRARVEFARRKYIVTS